MGQERIHRPIVHRLPGEEALLAVALQQSLALQKAPDTLRDRVGQFGELGGSRRPHPAKPLDLSIDPHDIDPIQEQHVEVEVKFSALPKRWISVTAPVRAVRRVNPAFLIRWPEMTR